MVGPAVVIVLICQWWGRKLEEEVAKKEGVS